MQYVKDVAVCIIFLLVMLLSWHFSTVHNVSPRALHDVDVFLFTGVGLAICGFLLTKVRIGWISLPGQGMLFGSLIGIVPCVMYYISEFFVSIISGASGFGMGLLAWLFFAIFIAASAALSVSAVKNAVLSVIKLDFYPVLVCIIVFFSAIMTMIILFTRAQAISDFFAFVSLLGIFGGVGGWFVEAPGATREVRDDNGNIHYVISTLSSDRVITTSGQTLRRSADNSGIYKPLN